MQDVGLLARFSRFMRYDDNELEPTCTRKGAPAQNRYPYVGIEEKKDVVDALPYTECSPNPTQSQGEGGLRV